MQLIGLILPILALYGYYEGYMTLFYWTGSIVAVLDILAVLTGALRCVGTFLTVSCCVYFCKQVDSTWEGIVLGSCYSSIVVLGLMSIVLIPVALVAIAGIISSPFVWLKKKFSDE